MNTWVEFGGSDCDTGIDFPPVVGQFALESPVEGADAPDDRDLNDRSVRGITRGIDKSVVSCWFLIT